MNENLKMFIPQDERAEVDDLLETMDITSGDQEKVMLALFQGVALGRMLAERSHPTRGAWIEIGSFQK